MNADFAIIVAITAVGGIILLLVGGVMVTIAMRPKMRLKKRMESIGTIANSGTVSAKAESRRQKRIQEKLKGVGAKDKKEGIADKIAIALLQAGIQMDPNIFLMGCIGAGVLGAVVPLVMGMDLITIPIGAILLGAGIPKFILGTIAKRRQAAFTLHFAEAIDVITRGIRSGLPVGECLNVISREFEGPVGEEFTMIVEGQRLGMTLEDILSRALKRIPTAEFKFFAIVLQIQKKTGGNLADTLENLTEVLRDRKRMKDKIQALSSEAKSSAGIIASLPFAVLGLLSVVNPDYVAVLFGEGIHLVYIGLGTMATGVMVMRQMINFDI
ncbi:MAG: type II secretion system F family protein [Rhodospirillales bacterium]|nr:type II secretion system F family protein [Rhodospirillales bacterium]